MKEKGIIYILTNDSMPGLVKIGITNNIKERLKSLDTSGVPTPFNLYYAIEVDNYQKKEKLIHEGFTNNRIRPNREFFKIEPEYATAILKAVGGKEVDPEFINISVDESGTEISSDTYDDKLPPAPITTFEMLNIPHGSELIFTRDKNTICTVVDNRKVEYKGQVYSVTALARILLQGQYNWKTHNINGFQYWMYEDEILTDRRARLEQGQNED